VNAIESDFVRVGSGEESTSREFILSITRAVLTRVIRRANRHQAQNTRLDATHACKKARIGLSTLDALENGRLGELGYSKITNILTALRMELKLQEASARRPTLDELMEEGRDDQGLDRRH
jgi:hypothetical protein